MKFSGRFVVLIYRSIEQRLAAPFDFVFVREGPEESLAGAEVRD